MPETSDFATWRWGSAAAGGILVVGAIHYLGLSDRALPMFVLISRSGST